MTSTTPSSLNCPICGHQSFSHLLTCTDHLVSKTQFDIIECQKCAMRITKDFPNETAIGHYYESEAYISHSDTQQGVVNWAYHTVRKMMLQQKAQWVSRFSKRTSGRLLDVGTGTGYFAHKMQTDGWEVSAIEKSDAARSFCLQKFQIEAYETLQAYTAQSQKKLDVITLWHVLEHIENLHETLSTFHSLLHKGGTLIIAVPNCDSYDAKRYKQHWAAYDVPRHLWHFRSKQIELLGRQHGFELVESKPMYFDAFYISLMSERYRQSRLPLLKGIFNGAVGGTMTLIDKKQSSSLVYFLQKQ